VRQRAKCNLHPVDPLNSCPPVGMTRGQQLQERSVDLCNLSYGPPRLESATHRRLAEDRNRSLAEDLELTDRP